MIYLNDCWIFIKNRSQDGAGPPGHETSEFAHNTVDVL